MTRKSKSLTLIEDPRLEPYFISKDDNCYTVCERVISDGTHFRAKSAGNEYHKPQGYYAKFDQALSKILQEKANILGSHNLDEYITRLENINKNLKSYTDDIRI